MKVLKDKHSTPNIYAELYSQYKISGTPYLPYRDMPAILKKYTPGTLSLDYGCGTGESTLFLKSQGYKVIGVDINDEMIKIAESRDHNGKYIIVDGLNLPFDDNFFDLVFCSFVLLEISKRELIYSVVKEIKRVLKNNGIFISIGANQNTYSKNWFSLNTNFDENKNPISGNNVKIEFKKENFAIYDYYWDDEDYKSIFEEAGLLVLDIHHPIGTKNDGVSWIDEMQYAPSSIVVSKKINS